MVGVRMAWSQPKIISKNTIYVRTPASTISGTPTSPACIIYYSYRDQLGNMYEGHSKYLSVAGAMLKPGDLGLAFRPSTSRKEHLDPGAVIRSASDAWRWS